MDKLMPRISQMQDRLFQDDLFKLFQGIYYRFNSMALNEAGLAIVGAGNTAVKTGATPTVVSVNGVLASIAAATTLPVLAGTVLNATFNVFVFSQDSAGTRYTTMGTGAATLAGVKFPVIPDNRAILGFIVVNPTGAGNFVGGTTALDDAGVVPNVAYVNMHGASCVTAAIQ